MWTILSGEVAYVGWQVRYDVEDIDVCADIRFYKKSSLKLKNKIIYKNGLHFNYKEVLIVTT